MCLVCAAYIAAAVRTPQVVTSVLARVPAPVVEPPLPVASSTSPLQQQQQPQQIEAPGSDDTGDGDGLRIDATAVMSHDVPAVETRDRPFCVDSVLPELYGGSGLVRLVLQDGGRGVSPAFKLASPSPARGSEAQATRTMMLSVPTFETFDGRGLSLEKQVRVGSWTCSLFSDNWESGGRRGVAVVE
jgi:hypothetical protein